MTRLRRLAERIASGLLDRFGNGAGLDEAQRTWLLEDVEEDLAAMVDDAEDRGVTERAAREMLVIRALVGWLEGGEQPGVEAIGYLERAIEAIPRNPAEDELTQQRTYLAAIGDLGGDEESAPWLRREPSGDPGQIRRMLDLQGRRIRELMEERRLTVGELAARTGIDTVTLVSILFGLEEMRAVEWMRLSDALGVSPDDLMDGHRLAAADEVPELPDATPVGTARVEGRRDERRRAARPEPEGPPPRRHEPGRPLQTDRAPPHRDQHARARRQDPALDTAIKILGSAGADPKDLVAGVAWHEPPRWDERGWFTIFGLEEPADLRPLRHGSGD